MTRLARDPSPLIEKFYQAALEPSLWESALRGIRNHTATEGIVFSCCDVTEFEKEQPTLLVDLDPHVWDLYCRHYIGSCPAIKFAVENRPEHVFYDYNHTEEKEIRSNEYYAFLQREWGTSYYMGLMFNISDNMQGHLGVHRTTSCGHAQQKDLAFMEVIRPHIHRALQLNYNLEFANAPSAARSNSSNVKQQGLILLNKHGALLYMDEYAEQITSSNDGVFISDRRLRAASSYDDTKLNLLISSVIRGAGRNLDGSGGALIISRPSTKKPFHVLVSRLPRRQTQGLFNSAVAIFISNPESFKTPPMEDLKQLYGLTQKEALLLFEFVKHTSLTVAADKLGISKNTARAHLKNIFCKTETKSQTELIKLVLSS